MRFFTNGEEKNMSEEEIRKLEQDVKENADEIAQSAVRKIEAFTRIITLLGFVVTAIILWVNITRGNFDDRTLRLLLWHVEATPTTYVLFIATLVVVLWHLVSTVRFFIKRNKENKNEGE
ncbi:MAG: hypothetical protein FWC16_00490 [Defluviitaleaceae bacterium]|nr:hypothetical protein [Defluviitaleaceae bacterium]MCL2273381.1 hypothetical protein [Defluviitaleaceae bacterium]